MWPKSDNYGLSKDQVVAAIESLRNLQPEEVDEVAAPRVDLLLPLRSAFVLLCFEYR